jgi:hypothetical protein
MVMVLRVTVVELESNGNSVREERFVPVRVD